MLRWLLTIGIIGLAALLTGCPKPQVVGVIVTPAVVTLETGETLQFMASVQPPKANQVVIWSSDDPAIASVSETGIVTGEGVGTTTVTATSRADRAFAASAAVTVVADDPAPPDPEVHEGTLVGPNDDPALDHTLDLYVPRELDPDEISEDPAIEDREVLRTEIEVLFVQDITVGEVNALLADVDGAIVGMTQGVPAYVIRIPDPGDLASLRALIDVLEARDEVVLVLEAVLVRPEPFMEAAPSVAPQVLPPGLGLDRIDRVDHHLAVRGHAAWNARQALPSLQARPWLLIADSFGNGAPNADVDAGLVSDDFADVAGGSSHGYHVLGIATAYFGESGESAARNRITGMFPSSLRVRAADTFDNAVGTTWADLPVLMITRMRAMLDEDPVARIVINTSLNSRSLSASERERRAYLWAWRVRAADLENRTVHLTSAGNVSSGATWPAEENSIFTKAALSDTSIRIGIITMSQPQLTNTLVVENRVNTASGTQRPEPGCLSSGTQLGGTISAMGMRVWSFTGPDSGAGVASGTSMASPQVAGLAAYVWSLAPALDAQAVIDVLHDTARDMNVDTTTGFGCHDDTGTAVIDAYDAILAAGGATVRRAILDVTGSGTFSEHDLARILQEFDARDGALDYSRYDLNGSGHTGGPSTERFDLDMSGGYGTVTQAAGGVTLTFTESVVSDIDVLCYYAFSELYSGDEALRFELLASRCGIVPLAVRIQEVTERHCTRTPITLQAEVTHPGSPRVFPSEQITWWVGDPPQEQTGNPIDVQFDAEGVVPVRVRVTDQYGQYAEATIDLNVQHCVVARPDSSMVYVLAGAIEGVFEEHTVLIDVLANDVSTAGERLSIVSVDFDDWDATSGTVDIVDLADVDRAAILYTGVVPREFTYLVSDESNRQDTAVVTITKSDPRFPTADDLLPAGFFDGIDCRFVPWPEWPLPCCINERDDVAWTIGSDFPQEPPFEPQTWRARISHGDGRQIDLGTLGGDRSHAHGLNDDGWVVGVSNTANGALRAFLWAPHRGMVNLGTLAGGQGSVAMDVGNAGSVVGYTGFADGRLRATLWTNAGGITDLGPAFHEDVRSVAMGVVDSPRWGPIVVGTVLPPVGVATADLIIIVPPAEYDIGAFMWIDADGNGLASSDEITWLPTTDDAISFATGINAALQVIGHTSVDGHQRGFVWSPGSPGLTLLEAPPQTDTQLFGINRHGHVVGTIEADLSMTGTIWDGGRMRFQDDMANALSRIVRLLDLNDRGNMLGQVLDTRDSCLSPVRFVFE